MVVLCFILNMNELSNLLFCRIMKRLCVFIFVAFSTIMMMAQGVKPLPSLHVDGKWLVDKHGNHVVLHGVMDTPSAWFNNGRWGWSYDDAGRLRCLDYFEKLYTGLEEAKCNVFRLHLEPAWTNDNTSGYTYAGSVGQSSDASGEADISKFNPTRLKNYLNTLYFPLMQKAMNHGMYVVVRPPGVCPNTIQVDGYYQQYLMEVWNLVTQNDSIKKYAGQISLELANEPVNVKNASGNTDAKALHDFFQPIVEKIRENGFTGVIWIPGAGWQANYTDYKKHPVTGNNIGYAVHDYDGWYGCNDSQLSASDVPNATQKKITQFHNQVPVVDTNPVIVTEIDWSPKNPGSGHYNEHGEWVESNYGTWATARTSVWGQITKNVYDYYGNISMTLSGTACLLDIDKLVADGTVAPAFDGLEEACGKACMDWYADYYKVNWPHADNESGEGPAVDVMEDNMLYIADGLRFSKNKTNLLPVSLKNKDQVVGFQLDVVLPDGMSLALNNKGKYDITKTDRLADHSLSSNILPDGSIRIVGTSMNNDIIADVDGALVNIGVDVTDWLANGEYAIQLKNVKMTNENKQTLTCADKTFIVKIGGKMGDVNNDDAIDVTDAVLIIDDILMKNPANFDASLADVNNDGSIDVTDVVMVIDAILGKIQLARGVEASQKDLTAYTAFQMDLTVPAGYVLEGVELTEIAKDSHKLAYNMLSDGRCRVVVFSMDNEALPGAWDEVIRLNLRGQGETYVNVERAMFVTVGGERHELLLNGTTSIAQLSTLNSQFSIVYDLTGRKVEKSSKGVYVIDGKKVVK